MKTKIQLKVFTKDQKPLLSVLELNPPETRFFVADGPVDFFCGKCQNILAENVHMGIIKKCLLKCSNCGSLNETQ